MCPLVCVVRIYEIRTKQQRFFSAASEWKVSCDSQSDFKTATPRQARRSQLNWTGLDWTTWLTLEKNTCKSQHLELSMSKTWDPATDSYLADIYFCVFFIIRVDVNGGNAQFVRQSSCVFFD